jgi:hypothetical protein
MHLLFSSFRLFISDAAILARVFLDSLFTHLEALNYVYTCVSACFSVHVRGSEYIPLLGSSADPDYSFVGASDFDQ